MNMVPYNEDFEKAVIVSVLTDPRLLPKVSAIIGPEDFYRAKHREIFKAINSIEAESLDSLAVADKLSDETKTYFQNLVEDSERIVPSISNVLYYAETVRDKSKLRAGIDLGQSIISVCYGPDTEEAMHELEGMFASFIQRRVVENKGTATLSTFKQFIASLQTRKPDDPNAIKTGFTDLDLMVQKLEGLTVLAARPGMGKTALALNIIRNVAASQRNVVFFSLEQPQTQIFERMLSAESGVPLEDIRLGIFNHDETQQDQIQFGRKKLEHLMEYIHIDDRADVNNSYISSVSRQKKYEWGDIGLIVVDYLHIMRLNDKQKVDALGDAVKELRALGKELGAPVLLLAQLRRESAEDRGKKNHRPDLPDLRSSGEIEQSADMVWFIYRESYFDMAGEAPDTDVAEIIVRKSRNGRQGIISLEWKPTIQKFSDLPEMTTRR